MDFSMYFLQLSAGVLGLTPLVPWRQVGRGYYLMNLLVGLGLLAVAGFLRAAASGAGFPSFGPDAEGATNVAVAAYGGLALLATAAFLRGPGAAGSRLTLAAAVAGVLAVLCDGVRESLLAGGAPGAAASPAATAPLLALNFLAGAGLLGSVTGAMLLGHWYLVVRDLPVAPLRTLTVLLFVFLGARLALCGVAWALDPAGGAAMADRALVFLVVRLLFGLGAPLAMGGMIWGTVSIRSTQAATGILYGVVVFVLMGEAASRFILLRTGFPV